MQHTVVRDIIVQVQGSGWAFGLARILIDNESNAAVFVPPAAEPVATFRFTTGNDVAGSGEDADGGRVTYRRKATSCGFALAKCNVKTNTLTERWDRFDRISRVDVADEFNEIVGEPGPELVDLPPGTAVQTN